MAATQTYTFHAQDDLHALRISIDLQAPQHNQEEQSMLQHLFNFEEDKFLILMNSKHNLQADMTDVVRERDLLKEYKLRKRSSFFTKDLSSAQLLVQRIQQLQQMKLRYQLLLHATQQELLQLTQALEKEAEQKAAAATKKKITKPTKLLAQTSLADLNSTIPTMSEKRFQGLDSVPVHISVNNSTTLLHATENKLCKASMYMKKLLKTIQPNSMGVKLVQLDQNEERFSGHDLFKALQVENVERFVQYVENPNIQEKVCHIFCCTNYN